MRNKASAYFETGVKNWIERNHILIDDIITKYTKYYCPDGCKTSAGTRVEIIRRPASKFLKLIENNWPSPKSYLNKDRTYKFVKEVLLSHT